MEVKVEHINKTYGAEIILQDISFSLECGIKIGLVGNNGTGKSTLLKILAGEISADEGTIEYRKGAVVGYMPQDTGAAGCESVREYLCRVSGFSRLEKDMTTSASVLAEYERRDGYAFYGRMKAMLEGLDLETAINRALDTLSSGQRSKVFITGVLLSDPDIMLLDEPTNNLDLPSLLWFEEFVAQTDAACIIVSHDHLFLDRTVSKVFEIDWRTHTLSISNGTYSDYLARRLKETERQLEAYEAQREEINRLTESARDKRQQAERGSRFRGTDNDKFLRGFKRDRAGSSGRTAKAIERRIEQIDRIDRPIMRDALEIRLDAQKPDGSRDIALEELTVGYANSDIHVEIGNLYIPYGHRIAILGLNGAGKSTLLRTISNELFPLRGSVRVGKALVIGNFTQEHHDLPKEETLYSFLSGRVKLPKEHIYMLVKKYGFSAPQVEHPISGLSPGGRARLLFALFSALSVNMLLLDEPTNHLDVEALAALEVMLQTYSGTVIIVSHDRHFLQLFGPNDIYIIDAGQFKRLPSLDAYLAAASQRAEQLMRRMS